MALLGPNNKPMTKYLALKHFKLNLLVAIVSIDYYEISNTLITLKVVYLQLTLVSNLI